MIVVRVELVSARNGLTTELARMIITNDGEETVSNPNFGSYDARVLRGRDSTALDANVTQRKTRIDHWPRKAKHVWNLVATALAKMNYGG